MNVSQREGDHDKDRDNRGFSTYRLSLTNHAFWLWLWIVVFAVQITTLREGDMTQEERKQLSNELADVLGQEHVFTSYRGDKLEDFSKLSYDSFSLPNKLRPLEEQGAAYYIPALLSGSDYLGSSVEASNFRVWCETFKDSQGEIWWELFGGWGTYAIALDITKATEAMIETLEGLDSYPLIAEDDLSELEHERERDAWNDYISGDFARALKKQFCNTGDEVVDEATENRID